MIGMKNKNIVLCFDGSGCDPKMHLSEGSDKGVWKLQGISNIQKLHLLAGGNLSIDGNIEPAVDGQVSLYVKGVGTYTESGNINSSAGFVNHTLWIMMDQLEEVYEKGDNLFILGWSRGAATAREFVSYMSKKGIKYINGESDMECFKKEERDYKPTIKFLGLFDCVSLQLLSFDIFGILKRLLLKQDPPPSVLGEENGFVADNVERAVHFVCLDDTRAFPGIPFDSTMFPPTLLGQIDGKTEEIWFPGSHSNIGGNFYSKDLSDLTLRMMIDRLKVAGLRFREQPFSEKTIEKVTEVENYNKEVVGEVVGDNNLDDIEALDQFNKWFSIKKSPEIEDPKEWVCFKTVKTDAKYRSIGISVNDKFDKNGLVKVHESLYTIFDRCVKDGKEIYTELTPYNKNLSNANFMVVNDQGEEVPAKTQKLKEILERTKVDEDPCKEG